MRVLSSGHGQKLVALRRISSQCLGASMRPSSTPPMRTRRPSPPSGLQDHRIAASCVPGYSRPLRAPPEWPNHLQCRFGSC
ncbi:uncharacterized protein ACA1_128220 [Acanthamoeba castellanii str. Neff]|uniref:Uncharacterized protein n=1 Tax=Acanthamoeba castellanii (strain ATCC 30010 / Neff) TaxID=1257118 RepID=L8GXY6_ACACF|nr:uncharacterized protein ACA1_128220 [Acanthamoeba castellanii str. Neff]ELR16956.1 hypothetical protein ACA1_128220 [Acanthamoeba castellanii str. Neff]